MSSDLSGSHAAAVSRILYPYSEQQGTHFVLAHITPHTCKTSDIVGETLYFGAVLNPLPGNPGRYIYIYLSSEVVAAVVVIYM